MMTIHRFSIVEIVHICTVDFIVFFDFKWYYFYYLSFSFRLFHSFIRLVWTDHCPKLSNQSNRKSFVRSHLTSSPHHFQPYFYILIFIISLLWYGADRLCSKCVMFKWWSQSSSSVCDSVSGGRRLTSGHNNRAHVANQSCSQIHMHLFVFICSHIQNFGRKYCFQFTPHIVASCHIALPARSAKHEPTQFASLVWTLFNFYHFFPLFFIIAISCYIYI